MCDVSRVRLSCPSLWVAGLLAAIAPCALAADAPDFNRDIQPILSENCYKCHGPDAAARKADLRLDREDSTFAVRKGKAAVVRGQPDKSELVRRITSKDPDEVMPPPDSNRELTARDIELLKRWVESGAKWGKHWSFVPPVRPELPAVKDPAWVRNPLDAFILARLEKEGLKPSPGAAREKLIRRATLDLTGLPPTPEEVDAFLADPSSDAYEKVVDRLLASPRYGERMVVDWLDAARYADTNGYQGDPTRTMWPWRDWAVEALNANMPFDRFATEQLAGDLLPNATPSQRLASGFNRNHTYNGEGGRIPDETRVENVFDRVETFGTVFLGLTIGCTRCHDHKFDPVTQKEYYQLFAYFNQSSETGELKYPGGGGNAAPIMTWTTPEQEKRLAALNGEVKAAEEKLSAALATIDAGQAEWEKQATAGTLTWNVVRPQSLSARSGATLATQEDGSVLASGTLAKTDEYDLVLRTDEASVTGLRLEVLGHPSLPEGGPGRAKNGNFTLTGIEGEAVSVADPKQTKPVKFNVAASYAEYSQPNQDVKGAVDSDPGSGWAVHAAPKKDLAAQFAFAEPLSFAGGTELRLRFKQDYAGSDPPGQHLLGRFRLSLTAGPVLPPPVAAALAVAADKRDDKQKQQVRDFYRRTASPAFKELNTRVEAARKTVGEFDKTLPKVMVMDDAKPRDTFILKRGGYDKPGDKVERGVPAVLSLPLPTGVPNNRLALAKWLFDPRNPLTARVTVNRYWQTFFGTGLVKTVEDFGAQGEKPSHPELLDWLATQFVQSGWDVKAIHRLIVTSNTYRQSSKVTPELLEKDPANRLLARGSRYRLSSFAIRDSALAAGGLLLEKRGGPPVKPYQPPGVWEEMSLDQIKYEPDHGEALYRRSIYTFWRRTVAPTTMFDVPQRTVCSVRQVRTNTPLQALALMNDTTYVEAARNLAERLLLDGTRTPEQKIERAFRLMTARRPSEAERKILSAALARLRGQYAADKDAAAKLVAVGEKPRDSKLDAPELAAWTALMSTIMNVDEAITRE